MKHPRLSLLVAAVALAGTSTIAVADEPGPGGTRVPRPVTGEQVYRAVCQACHMADAKGGAGAARIPALAGNPKVAASAYLPYIILHGRGAMPPLDDMLDAGQIAAVTTYVRTHFGNNYATPVTAEDVRRVMPGKK